MATCKDCVHYEPCFSGGISIWRDIEQTKDDHCRHLMLSADVAEAKHGYWKEPMDELKIFKGRYLICSQCNVMLPIITELAAYYYCPNCGAKMDGRCDT